VKPRFPTRLIEGDDAVARVLRAELERDDDARIVDFNALRARRARRQVQSQRWLAAAVVLGAAGLFASLVQPRRELSITAETLPERPPATSSSEKRPTVEQPANSLIEPPRAPSHVPVPETARRQSAVAATKKNDPGDSRVQTPSDTDCRDVVRSSGYEAGVRCYGNKAEQASGVGAEIAWIERARLESRALGRPNEALETLSTYERRFPTGTLATEASLTKIELLAAVGRREEALRAIGEAAPRIPERAGSLHLLGARLALETNDCSLAEQHLDAAVRARAPADRIDALRRSTKCFPESASSSE
jgi:hypothetical protein